MSGYEGVNVRVRGGECPGTRGWISGVRGGGYPGYEDTTLLNSLRLFRLPLCYDVTNPSITMALTHLLRSHYSLYYEVTYPSTITSLTFYFAFIDSSTMTSLISLL